MRALLFTGHRIDAPGRAKPRFPASAESEARRMIREAVQAQLALPGPPWRGIAGAASGGDILFHEVCDSLGTPTEVYLALDPADYLEASVADAGPDWIARFAAVAGSRPVRLPSDEGGAAPRDSVWQRSNLEMLAAARRLAGDDVALIALWNGAGGDGPGGTADLIERVRAADGQVVILDARKLLQV